MFVSLIRKVAWVGRATTFCGGLAVVLAVAFGVATSVLAPVPGDPFKLGRLNAVDRLTSLAGSVAGPLLRLDNNGSGPRPRVPGGPTSADRQLVRRQATNLDADRLDGEGDGGVRPRLAP